jgi:hypothetical protein
MLQHTPRSLPVLTLLAALGFACRSAQPTPASDPTDEPPPAAAAPPVCDAISDAPYHELPRTIAGNQFDPSGVALVQGTPWLINDREGRKGVPAHGNGVVRLDPATGEVAHVHVPGFDEVSRKFEGLAWDGHELHAIGNVGKRRANTFLVSFEVDPATQLPVGQARYHDLAAALGAATGLGAEPWGHGIKIEALSALGPGDLLIGLRRTGEGRAATFYRAAVPPRGTQGALLLDPVQELQGLALGTATGGASDAWTMTREVAGLAEPVCESRVTLGVASAEYEQGETWEFLSNGLFAWWPDLHRAELLCTFDPGLKAEGIVVAPDPAESGRGTLWLLYDNDSAAAGGYKRVPDVRLPCSPP